MTFAALRLPLLLALLACALAQLGLALATLAIPAAAPLAPLELEYDHVPTSAPATAAGVLALGGVLAGAWGTCA